LISCVILILLLNLDSFGNYVYWCLLEELNGESGNPIWKNRLESWKDKKNKKKKVTTKTEFEAQKEDQVPPEQQMDENQ
jgi:hypothetical protein